MMNAEKAVFVLLLMLVLFPCSVPAQEPGLAVTEVWSVQCAVQDDPSSCSMNQQQHLQTEVDGEKKIIGRLINATVLYADDPITGSRDPHISIDLPLGVSLVPGAAIKVDGGEQLNWPFLQCTAAGCAISNKLDSELLSALRRGKVLFVAYRAWGTEENTVIPVSLKGFTKAFNSIQ